MTKEDILKAYLEDDLFIEKSYLKEGEAQKYKWASHTENNLIQIIKTAIEGELSNESGNITERKINTFLNK
ncbi:hypothetical protein [Ferruginibacter sp.]|jgi:hypothetical protein|nr:hypothetical protein [Ferruginibacter sp.]